MSIYTIGHSTLDKESFLKLADPVTTIIDVRSHPTSRWEQHRKEELEQWLPSSGVGYEWWPELGGWTKRHLGLADKMKEHFVDVQAYANGKFPKQRIGKNFGHPDQVELQLEKRPTWYNQGLWDYSWFMSLPEFVEGGERLIERGRRDDVAIMCCECKWWCCHRSMISDFLAWRGIDSFHLMPRIRQKNKVKYTDGIKITRHFDSLGNRLERYDPGVAKAWTKRVTFPRPEANPVSG